MRAKFQDIKDHFGALMMEQVYFEAQPVSWRLRLSCAWEVLLRESIAAWCNFRGHDLEGETFAPESGGESLTCKRCGWSYDVRHN